MDIETQPENPPETPPTIRIISAYAPAKIAERSSFFTKDTMQLLAATYTLDNVILLGDLNDYPDPLLDRESTALGSGVACCWEDLAPFLEDMEDIPITIHGDTPLYTNIVKSNGKILTRTRIDNIYAKLSPSLKATTETGQTLSLTPFPQTDHLMVIWNWKGRDGKPRPEIPKGPEVWSLHIGHLRDDNLQAFIHDHMCSLIQAHQNTNGPSWTWAQ